MAKMGEDGKLSLGYWKIRGLVAPARMMLHYANIDYNDVEEKKCRTNFSAPK